MDRNLAAPVLTQALANKPGAASSEKASVKAEHLSSPPPLIGHTSGILEDGEIDEEQDAVDPQPSELQLSAFQYAALEDRFKRLERQHSELQDLASAYCEVIRGLSPTAGQTVSITQLQAEAGRDGLRTKALEADILRPLIREAGGLQALISQTHTTRTLIDKAGGLRELEQFVSDLRTIRDTLDEARGSRGLGGLASEVRELLTLKSQVNGPNGLRVKAVRYEKLEQAFSEIKTITSIQEHDAMVSMISSAEVTTKRRNTPANSHGQAPRCERPSAVHATMNPDRARMISATPLEADPDRDLYEAPLPPAKPGKKTGSNDTPLGTPQIQPTAKHSERNEIFSTLKRKGPDDIAPNAPAKRPRVDLTRASALVHASLPATANTSKGPVTYLRYLPGGQPSGTQNSEPRAQPSQTEVKTAGPSQIGTTGIRFGEAAFKTRSQVERGESVESLLGDAVTRPQTETSVASLKMPDWIRAGVSFGDVGSARTPSARYSSTPPSESAEPHADTRTGPVRFPPFVPKRTSQFATIKAAAEYGKQTALQYLSGSLSTELDALKSFFKHSIALWVGGPDDYVTTAWDAYQSHDLKKEAQIPDVLLAFLLRELAKHIHVGNSHTYEQMAPSGNTCILRYVIDAHKPSGLPQGRRACGICTSAWVRHSRPCALLQDVNGVRTIVFLPLRENLRTNEKWTEKTYWMREVKSMS